MTLFDRALNFLFPQKCRICGKRGDFEICKNCIKRIERFEEFRFFRFQNRYLDELIYFFKYKTNIRKMILGFKFFNQFYYGKVFSKIMLKNENFCRILKIYDIIISVPMHKNKLKERGYNQAEILAKDLAENMGLLYDKNILIKVVNNKRQSSLTEKERYENIKNVFKVQNMGKIKDKKIILVDDICTTSATLEECSKVLKESGAKKVTAVVIAKD